MAGGAIRAGTAYVDIRAGDTSHLVSGATDAARDAGRRASNELEGSIGQDAGAQTGGGFAGKFGGMLKAGLAGAALAAGALLKAGLETALENGKIKSHLQAQLGATPEVAAQAGKVAGQLYAKGITEDFQTAADAIKNVMQSGIAPPGATNEQLQSIATKAQDVAGTFDQDLGGVTNAVAQMMRTGLVSSANQAFDLITKGMQNGSDKAGDLLDTMNEYGTQFRKVGVDGPMAMGLISQAIKAGARDSDIAADAIKEFSIRAIDGSATTAAGFQALGLDATAMGAQIAKGGQSASDGLSVTLKKLREMPDPVARAAAATALFGTQSEDLGQALFAMDPSTAVSALGEVGGAADKMGASLRDNAATKIEVFKRTLMDGVTTAVGGYLLPALEKAGTFLASTLGPAFSAAKDFASQFFGAFSAGTGPMGDVTGKLSSLAATAQTTLGPALSGLWDVVQNKLLPAYMSVASAVANGFMPVLQTLGSILMDTVIPAVMRVYAAIYENVQPIITAFANAITTYVAPAVQRMGEKLNEVYQKAQPVISVVVLVTEKVAEFAAKILGVVIPPIIRFAGEVLGNMFNALGTAIGWIGNVIGWVVHFGSSVVDAAGSVGRFVGNVRQHFGDMVGAVRDKVGEAVDWVKGLPGRMTSGLGDLGSMLVDEGKHIVQGLINGIVSMGSSLASKVSSVVKDNIPGPIRDILGIHSPSRVTMELGMWTGQGMIDGLDSTSKDMKRSAEAYALDMSRSLAPASGGAFSAPVGSVGALGSAELGTGAYGASGGVGSPVTVNVQTNANPYEISKAIAWDLRNGGM
jgi:phage-related minor tail protein